MDSTSEEVPTTTGEVPVDRQSAKVDLPGQYRNWRDYAFSDFPEERGSGQE